MARGKDDPLSNEVSVSAAITTTGVRAKVRSRLISAVDRLLGNKVDAAGVQDERAAAVERAKLDADVKIVDALAKAQVKAIEGATKQLVDRIGRDPEFAIRTLESNYARMFRKQANIEGTLLESAEHLKLEPVSEEVSRAGEDTLNAEFLDRFEQYAERASTDDLKKRWGRVLAEEVKKPGTFGGKSLRVIDELDAKTAKLFEGFCQHRIEEMIPKCLSGDLTFDERTALVMSGLLLEPGMGQTNRFADATNLSLWRAGDYGVFIPADTPLPGSFPKGSALFGSIAKKIVVPVYVLTDAGASIATILENNQKAAVCRLAEAIANLLPGTTVRAIEFLHDARQIAQLGSYNIGSQGTK